MANGWYGQRRRHSIAARRSRVQEFEEQAPLASGIRGRHWHGFRYQTPYADRNYYGGRRIRRVA